MEALLQPASLGVTAGLFVGKQLGVFGAARLAVALRLARLPEGTTWSQVYGVAILAFGAVLLAASFGVGAAGGVSETSPNIALIVLAVLVLDDMSLRSS